MDIAQIQKKFGYGLLFGLFIYIGLSLWGDSQALMENLQTFHWIYFPLILGLTTFGYACRFLKWDIYLRTLQIRIPFRKSLIIFLSGFSMAITPGKAGEVVKSYQLKQSEGIEMSRTAPVVFAERMTDLLGMLLIASWGMSRFDYGQVFLWLTAIVLISIILLIQSRRLCLFLFEWLKEKFPSVLIINKIELFYESSFVLFRFPVLFSAILISACSWFFECVALYWIFQGLAVDRSLLDATFIFAFSSIAGAVSMLPGGLGVAETSMTGLMTVMGMEESQAITATLLGRFATLWFGVLIGSFVLLIWGRNYFKERK